MLIYSAASAAQRDGGPDLEADEIYEADGLDCQTDETSPADEISWVRDAPPNKLPNRPGANHNACERHVVSENYDPDDPRVNYNPERDPG